MKKQLNKYVQLIESFVSEIISVQDFEKEYLQLVKNETVLFDKEVAKIIEKLFSDVDAYCGNPEIANYNPSDPFADIDERELRKRAKYALEQLLTI